MRSLDLILELSVLADVVVHRLLSASLGIHKLPSVFQDRPQLTSIADSKFFFAVETQLPCCSG